MKKYLLSILLLSFNLYAASVDVHGAIVVRSEQYDVISCRQSDATGLCYFGFKEMTPEAYAKSLGYGYIHHRYVVISGSNTNIVLEVSK